MITGDRLPTLTASRVALRGLSDKDVDALFSIFSDPVVMRFWSSPPLADRSAADRLLANIHEHFGKRDLFQWGVALRDDDRVIGTCTLAEIDETNRRAELGFALGRSDWGNGYMGEALDALLAFAFGDLNLHRLEADVDPRNAASIKTLDRLGFRREGHMRERWLMNGEAQDSLFYGLLRREWQAGRESKNDTSD